MAEGVGGGVGLFPVIQNTSPATGSIGVITLSSTFAAADPTNGYVMCAGRQ
jgi:hypothetical protein